MNASSPIAAQAGSAAPNQPQIFESIDYVALKPGESYVQVNRQRVIYHPDGHITQELLPKANLLEQMIHAFRGKVYESAGTLNAFFDDPEQAKECVQAIAVHHKMHADICGTQITIAV